MSREIKFRAWHKRNKNIHEPSSMFQITTNGNIYSSGLNVTDDYVLMQYTGLKDKNGKEIYEGDVLQMLGDRLKIIIEFKGGHFFGKNISSTKYTHPEFNNRNWNHWEILGNIYKNPELLK